MISLLAALDPLTTLLALPCTCLTCKLHKNVEFCLINFAELKHVKLNINIA